MMNLEEIESLMDFRKCKQKTVDLVQNACLLFFNEKHTEDELGSYSYEVNICLEVYDRELKYDIEILTLLSDRLKYQCEQAELLRKYAKKSNIHLP